ncbi:MAG: DUF454 domain-containing protein [Clostridiales bacterium]|nr:DUF454 domain-containing protein [Clostridiales bacterium]
MNIKNILLIGAGFICLGFGAVGTVFPILPTTPFVLLAAACFSVASPKLQSKLKKSEFFRQYIEYYENNTGVPRETVRKSIIIVWIGLIISILLVRKLWATFLLTAIGVGVSIYLRSLIKE